MRYTSLLIFIFVFQSAFAQDYITTATAPKKIQSLMETIEQQLMQNDLAGAQANLEKSISMAPNYIDGLLLLGELYNTENKYEEGKDVLLKSIALDPNYNSKQWFFLAESDWNLDEWDECIQTATQFLTYTNISAERKATAQQMIRNSVFAKDAVNHPVPFDPKNLGSNINTSGNEYFPSITADEKMLIWTRLDGNVGTGEENFYYSIRNDSVWQPLKDMGDGVNTSYTEGALSISADGKTIAFASDRPNGAGSVDIYLAQWKNGTWSNIKNIGFPISIVTWESQPSLSADGNTIYFVSKGRPDSYGGYDIYVSHRGADGKWTIPDNLGPTINTKGDELTPFIHPDGRTIYFSSNGWPGMGGDDIFESKMDANDKWQTPVNLGYPINTKNDDNSFVVSLDGSRAYFSSSRSTAGGDMDLYEMALYDSARPTATIYVKGTVTNSVSKMPMGASLQLIDLSSGKVIYDFNSDATTGNYLITVPGGKDYALNVSAKGFLFHSENFSLKEMKDSKPVVLNIAMEPVAVGSSVVLKNVFFETGSYVLKDESKIELNKLVDLLKANPTMKIEIGGHTDDIGKDEDNLLLSANRAKSVNDYLVANGIDASRLSYKGYGETKPIADNKTEEGRALNRRTEFTIVQ